MRVYTNATNSVSRVHCASLICRNEGREKWISPEHVQGCDCRAFHSAVVKSLLVIIFTHHIVALGEKKLQKKHCVPFLVGSLPLEIVIRHFNVIT